MTDRLSEDLKSLRIDRSKRTVDTGRKRWVLAALLVLLIVLVAGAVAFFPERAGLSSLGAKPREVEVATVVRQSGGSDQVVLTASGYIVPRRRLDLASIPPKLKGESKRTALDRETTLWDNWLTLAILVFVYSLDVGLRRLVGLS